jgi:hypothetical protein
LTRALLSLPLLGLVLSSPTIAADILSITVDSDKGVYTMKSEVWFDVNIERTFEVYRYWDYSSQFSSAIVEARDMEPDEQGRPQFYIRNKGCVLFYCQSFERQGYVEAEVNSALRAYANPETSDFHISNESWQFVAHNGGTLVTYNLTMKPKFWIPPGIGPFMIKRKLKKNGGEAVDRIEVIAQGLNNE